MIWNIIKMQVGDIVTWDINKNTRTCEIYNIYTDQEGHTYYDVLLSERNVPIESIYVPFGTDKLSKGDVVLYKKLNDVYEAWVSKVDWNSNSVQIRIIQQRLYLTE